jgi:mRNA interferase MazF
MSRVQVASITSNADKLYPSEAYATFRGKKSKAMADQITTVSKKRLINSDGFVSKNEMDGLSKAIAT